MEQSRKLIKDTKKKFFLYSLIGISFVVFVSYLALKTHVQNMKKQSSIQEMYSMITLQLNLVNKISLLSEKFDSNESTANKEIAASDFQKLLEELNKENEKLNLWLEKNKFPVLHNMEALLKSDNVKKQMVLFIKRAKELLHKESLTNLEIKKNIQFLSMSSRKGLGEILTFVGQKLRKEQTDSLSLLNKMGFALIALCLLQVLLVWTLVFRPLYNTILVQHQKISDAVLKAQSASRSKTDFLANISHEIRTPMTAILGYADILKRETNTQEEKNDAIEIIDQNASHLLGLIDEILDISKIEAGKFDFEKEKINLSSFLNEVYSLINVKSEDKGIELVFKNEGKIPEQIMTDPKRLKQILFNVLGNAIKFTEKGFVELKLSYLKKKNSLSMKVKDTGIGISSEQQKRLFRPFEQADTSMARRFGGTGLGLVLSKGLAQGMGGDIKILKSQVNVGTTMEILIDVGEIEDLELVSSFSTSVIEEKKESEILNTKLSGTKILVVDDAKENARLFKLYLSEAGATVKVANDGEKAIELARHTFFDIVLLDLQMPGKDGFQVIQELRECSFDNPIVALTAHAMKEEKEKTKNAGFDGHITKPVKPKVLIDSVYKHIQNESAKA